MNSKPKRKDTSSSKTGVIPRFFDAVEKRYEPPMPVTLPEFDQLDDGATGVMTLKAEGDDEAKEQDDDPTESARVS